MQPLLSTRPAPVKVVLAGAVPIAFGALCGWLLGVDKTAYLVLSLLAIAGGYLAGMEHEGARQGALRGLAGGALFGSSILLVHQATGKTAKADLPNPEIVLVAVTTVAGVVLGALGGRRRANMPEEDTDKPAFSLKRVHSAELIGFVGVAIVAFSLFVLDWFSTSCSAAGVPKGCNPNSKIHGMFGSFTGWETYTILRWFLLAGLIAPFVLAYIIARGHELSWRPGEVTMIVGMVMFALILLDGIILGRPGSSIEISLEIGYFVGLLGAFLICVGGFRRQAENVKAKPPGI